MASGFPGSIDNFTDPLSNSSLSSPSHAGQHSDLNDAVEKIETYMGLVKVIPTGATNGTVAANGTVTIGNAVSSVSVAGCFSSLYDNYRIISHGGSGSTGVFRLTFDLNGTPSATAYYVAYKGTFYAGGDGQYNGNNVGNIFVAGGGQTSNWMLVSMDVFGVNKAIYTNFAGDYVGTDNAGRFGGVHAIGTAYNGFTITSNSGTMTGGSIRVYGYRN